MVVKKITGDAVGATRSSAETLIQHLLRELPELVAVAVVDTASSKMVAAYTATPKFDPYKLTGRSTDLFRGLQRMLAAPWLQGQQVTDLVVVLDEQLHCLRPVGQGRQIVYLVVRLADTNMSLVRDILRRHAF
ncbi:hypothetical protein Hsw_2378 [Hymenobacter swuensis DY53]|uniref:Roadblock/LAMTOR2 domain-containing protein n=1 Tax=Hymenobacter swuensis DY53 TaxID=1227739 RepID=W8EZC2_9BACT|nr:hypothetical protein Hsw_2107 [Hymenobacter swuensis DY53]AHJ97973.1 hypothetical protein Hsw_2378 [Hymenobacter swuensis DY53]